MSGSGAAAYALIITSRAKAKAEATRIQSQADAEAAKVMATAKLEAQRLEIQGRTEIDKANAESLSKELERVSKTLKDLQDKTDIIEMEHRIEVERLAKQLEMVTKHQTNTYEELKTAWDKIKELEQHV